MARIFISYAREDVATAQSFYLQLKTELGHEPWMDQPPKPYRHLGIDAGEDWYSRLENEIGKADAALFLISKHLISKSGIVQKEQRLLLDKVASRPMDVVFLMPVVIDDTGNSDIPNTRVGTIHLKDLNIVWIEDGRLDALASTLNRLQAQINTYPAGKADLVIPLASSTLVEPVTEVPEYRESGLGTWGRISMEMFRVRWSQSVGKQRRSYRPIPVDDKLIIASCGREYGKIDDRTGIYALDPVSGSQVWFAQTQGDPGEVAVIRGRVFVGTRGGQVLCLDPSSGKAIWEKQGNHPIDIAPQLWDTEVTNPALVVVERGGRFVLLDPVSGSFKGVDGLNRRLWHAPIVCRDRTLILFSQEGELLQFEISSSGVKLRTRIEYRFDETYSSNSELCRFEAAPLVIGDAAYVPFSRATSYDSLPLLAIDLASLETIWREPRPDAQTVWSDPISGQPTSEHFGSGNIRHRPLAIGDDRLAVTPAYSSDAFIVNRQRSAIERAVRMFPAFRSQLAAPAAWRTGEFLTPRADGYVYAIDLANVRWRYRIDCSRPVTLGEVQYNVAAGGTLPVFEVPREETPRSPSAFVGEMLVSVDGFTIATREGEVHRFELQ